MNKDYPASRVGDVFIMSSIVTSTIIFSLFKANNIINWPWYWIISPFWIYILILIWFTILVELPLPLKYIGICATVMFVILQLSKII